MSEEIDLKILITEIEESRLQHNATVRAVLSSGARHGNNTLRTFAYKYDIAVRDLLNYLKTSLTVKENSL